MQLYAQHPVVRPRQVAADVGMLAWLVRLGAGRPRGARRRPRARRARAGGRGPRHARSPAAWTPRPTPPSGCRSSATSWPAPFDALADASGSVSGAGQCRAGRRRHPRDRARRRPRRAAGRLAAAALAAVAAAATPGRPARRARLLTGTPDLEMLAARALATAPLPRLAALPAGTGAAWRAGDPAAVRALAGLELRRLGLRLPDRPTAGRDRRLSCRADSRVEASRRRRAAGLRGRGPVLGRREQPDDRRGVADVAVEDPLDGVGQRHPLERSCRPPRARRRSPRDGRRR